MLDLAEWVCSNVASVDKEYKVLLWFPTMLKDLAVTTECTDGCNLSAPRASRGSD